MHCAPSVSAPTISAPSRSSRTCCRGPSIALSGCTSCRKKTGVCRVRMTHPRCPASSRVIQRVGGRQEIAVDVRVVCATHQSLKKQIETGIFRGDLYYRLAEIIVEIPPLRARRGDATLLAHAFVRRFAEEQRRSSMTLA